MGGNQETVPVTGEAVLEYKAATAGGLSGGVIDSSDDGYEHVIITSVTGVVDAVGDVIEPGSYAETLTKRRPKQINSHDWARPQGKYLWIKELLPGDPGLPDRTPNGDPWPREAGALVGKVRLFKGTQEGREAAERWSSENGYGADTQFSVGYRATKSRRDQRTGYRHITKMDLFETSEVLWGAMPLSGPMPQPLAAKVLHGVDADSEELEPATAEAEPEELAGLEEVAPAEDTQPEQPVTEAPLAEPPVADEDDGDEAGQGEDVGPEDIPAVEEEPGEAKAAKAPPAKTPAADGPDAQGFADDAGLSLDELAQIAADLDSGKEPSVTPRATKKPAPPVANADAPAAEMKRQFTADQRQQAADAGSAMPDGSFPIKNSDDLKNAVSAFGRAKDKVAAKKHIIQRAKALGLMSELPAGWQTQAKMDLSAYTDFLQVATMLPDEDLIGLASAGDDEGKAFDSALHPHVPAGSSAGGQFAPKAGSSSQQGAAAAQKQPAAKPAAAKPVAKPAAKPAAGAKKTGAKKGKKKARTASQSKALRDKAKALRKAAAAQRKATRLKIRMQLRKQRGAEMDRRDKVDTGLDKVKEAEDSRRDAADAAIEKLQASSPAKAKAARKAEAEKRKAFAATFKAQKKAERERRKAFAISLRKQGVARRIADRTSAATDRHQQDALQNQADKLESQGKSAAEELELKGLVAGVEAHPYQPNMTYEACVACDEMADEPVHSDDDPTKAAYAAREDAAWDAEPYPDDVMPGEELDDTPDTTAPQDGAAQDAQPPAQAKADDGDLEEKKGGADSNRGNAETLRKYWRTHEVWGRPGDFMSCVHDVSKYMTTEHAKGYCALRHKEVTGEWPGPNAHGGGLIRKATGKKDDAVEPETADADTSAVEEKLAEWDPTAEVGELAAHLEAKLGADAMNGSLESVLAQLCAAVRQVLTGGDANPGDPNAAYVSIEATFPGYVLAGKHSWQTEEHDYFQVSYGFAEDGSIQLGDPVKVQLQVTATPEQVPQAAEGIALSAAWQMKNLLDSLPEEKAGRVLSQINVGRLRQAVTQLISVLQAAGVPIDTPSDKQVEDLAQSNIEPVVLPDTTSDSAREQKDDQAPAEPDDDRVVMDPAVYAAGLSFLAGAVRR